MPRTKTKGSSKVPLSDSYGFISSAGWCVYFPNIADVHVVTQIRAFPGFFSPRARASLMPRSSCAKLIVKLIGDEFRPASSVSLRGFFPAWNCFVSQFLLLFYFFAEANFRPSNSYSCVDTKCSILAPERENMLAFHRGMNIMAHNSFPSLTSLFWEKSGDECVIAHEGCRLLSASPVISLAGVFFAIRTPVCNNREMLHWEPGAIWLPEGTEQRLNTLRHKWLALCEVLRGGFFTIWIN